jgi:hypothetical protein
MARAEKAVLDFSRDDAGMLRDAIASFEVAKGWINVTPGIPSDAVADDRSLFSWLVGARPQVAPLVTWMPDEKHAGVGTLGVLHARGQLTSQELAALDVPEGWMLRQNHARRGLLFFVPSIDADQLCTTMLRFSDYLATVATTGRYLAEVFTRS